MATLTIARLAEEIERLLAEENPAAASSISINEIKISIGQVCNKLLKADYATNVKLGETIPNGSMIGLYENIAVNNNSGKSQAVLPIKPLKLPRNMGVWGVYPRYEVNGVYEYDKEFIPLQMGQSGLLKSQAMINDLLGQVGYEVFGDRVFFTKDIKTLFPDVVVAMRLVIMDISQYGDYDPLPILPEMEWDIKQEVYKIYATEVTLGKIVDATAKEEKGVPINEQRQQS